MTPLEEKFQVAFQLESLADDYDHFNYSDPLAKHLNEHNVLALRVLATSLREGRELIVSEVLQAIPAVVIRDLPRKSREYLKQLGA